jgi:hypothetical protein
MSDESEDFAIAVTADLTQAGAAFDKLEAIVVQAATAVGSHLALLDKAVAGGTGGLLKMAAQMTPLGRAASALVEGLDLAAGTARKVAEAFGGPETQDALGHFDESLGDLRTAVSSTFDYIVNEATSGQHSVGRVLSALATGDAEALAHALNVVSEAAADAVRNLQVVVESIKPAEARSDSALTQQIDNLTQRLTTLHRALEEHQGDSLSGKLSRALDFNDLAGTLRGQIDQVESEIARLQGILAQRIEPPTGPPATFSTALEDAIEAIRRQNRELEIQAATFGMTAAEAARYRAEIDKIKLFGDEGGIRDPFGRLGEYEAQQERNARLAQERADQERSRRAGEQQRRMAASARLDAAAAALRQPMGSHPS